METTILSGAEDRKFWEQFGVVATDLQRINVELTDRASGERVFWNADDVLQDRMRLGTGRQGLQLKPVLAALREGCRKALSAAETLLTWHRTRLHLQPQEADPRRLEGRAVLEWSAPPEAPAVEQLELEEFLQGRWSGRSLVRDPGYARFAQDLTGAAARIVDACKKLSATHEVRLSLRTFDPPRP